MAERAWRSVLVMLIGVLLLPVAAHAQHRRDAVLVARMIDVETGDPLEGVELRLVELGGVARSDRQGIVHFTKIPPGSYNLFARRLGYRPFVGSLEFHAGDSIEVAIVLQSLQVLDTVKVQGRVALWPQLQEFHSRERKGFGHFLDDSVLTRLRDMPLTTVLTTRIPGLARLWNDSAQIYQLMSRRGNDTGWVPAQCFVSVYLDDVSLPDGDLTFLHTGDLAGVEYYSEVTAPARYRTLGSGCGVLLLWSKPSIR